MNCIILDTYYILYLVLISGIMSFSLLQEEGSEFVAWGWQFHMENQQHLIILVSECNGGFFVFKWNLNISITCKRIFTV